MATASRDFRSREPLRLVARVTLVRMVEIWGNVAEWVTGLGTVFALGLAIWLAVKAQREALQLRREALEDTRTRQARRVYAAPMLGREETVRAADGTTAKVLHHKGRVVNASKYPVFNVEVWASARPRFVSEPILEGNGVRWSSPVLLPGHEEFDTPFQYTLRPGDDPEHSVVELELWFDDEAGVRWLRMSPGQVLVRAEDHTEPPPKETKVRSLLRRVRRSAWRRPDAMRPSSARSAPWLGQ